MIGPKSRPRLVDAFWARAEPVMVNVDGQQVALTYSFDSEIGLHNVVRFLRSDASAAQEGEALLSKPELAVPRSTLAATFGLTPKQVDAFAIRRGVQVPADADVPLSAVNPRYLKSALLANPRLSNDTKWGVLRSLGEKVVALLAQRGLTTVFDLDEADVELKHPSAETRPKAFYGAMQTLHAEITEPTSHLHLGIPAIVPLEKARFVAAAVEAKVTLQRLAVTHEFDKRLVYKGSLFNRYTSGARGIVKFEGYAFAKPAPAHDLEIRQWLDIDHGMELLAMVATMARQPERLPSFDISSKAAVDACYGAVAASLSFVAQHLEHHPDKSLRALVPKLRELALEGADYIHAALLEKAHRLLAETRLADRLDVETFLAKAAG